MNPYVYSRGHKGFQGRKQQSQSLLKEILSAQLGTAMAFAMVLFAAGSAASLTALAYAEITTGDFSSLAPIAQAQKPGRVLGLATTGNNQQVCGYNTANCLNHELLDFNGSAFRARMDYNLEPGLTGAIRVNTWPFMDNIQGSGYGTTGYDLLPGKTYTFILYKKSGSQTLGRLSTLSLTMPAAQSASAYAPASPTLPQTNTSNSFASYPATSTTITLDVVRVGEIIDRAGTLYLVAQDGLYGIPSLNVFNSWGWNLSKVLVANSVERALPQIGVVPPKDQDCVSPVDQMTGLCGNPNSSAASVAFYKGPFRAAYATCGETVTLDVSNYRGLQIWLTQYKNGSTIPSYDKLEALPDNYTLVCNQDEGNYVNNVYAVVNGQKGVLLGSVNFRVDGEPVDLPTQQPSLAPSPAFYSNGVKVGSITCGQPFTFKLDNMPDSQIWLTQWKNSLTSSSTTANYDAVYNVPQTYTSVCGKDEGVYENYAYRVVNGHASTYLGSSSIVITPANAVAPALSITSPLVLTDGVAGLNYYYTFSAAGGTAPYTWKVMSSNYPYPCCVIGVQTNGMFSSSYPVSAGNYDVGVMVTDAAGKTASGIFTYTIKPTTSIPAATTTPPTIPSNAAPAFYVNGSKATSAVCNQSITFKVDNYSASKVWISQSKNGTSNYVGNYSVPATYNIICGTDEGAYHTDVYALDSAGRQSAYIGSADFTITGQPLLPTPEYYVNGSKATSADCGVAATFKVSNYSGSQVWLTQYKNYTSTATYNGPYNIPSTYTFVCGQDEGNYTNEVYSYTNGQKGLKIGTVYFNVIPVTVTPTPTPAPTPVVATPGYTFSHNNTSLKAGVDAWTYTLYSAQQNDKLEVEAYKGGNYIGRFTVCQVPSATVAFAASTCSASATPQSGDIGNWYETVYINGVWKGTVSFSVVP